MHVEHMYRVSVHVACILDRTSVTSMHCICAIMGVSECLYTVITLCKVTISELHTWMKSMILVATINSN